MTRFFTLLSFFCLSALIFTSCKDDTISPAISDPKLLYSSNEITCDYHDSIVVYNNGTPYIFYLKTIMLNITDRAFTKVKISGNAESYFCHDSIHEYGVSLEMGVLKDTAERHDGDTLTYYYRHLGNFTCVTTVTYSDNDPYYIIFAMKISNPARGDYMKVKNLAFHKLE